MRKAIFLDKDGTMIRDLPYNVDPAKIEFTPGALDVIARLKSLGYLLIVITNQSGVARGFFQETNLGPLFQHIQEETARVGAGLDGFYFCPHHPCGIVDKYNVDCDCRKPKPGMILQAAKDFNIALQESWMIGDILHDVEAGSRAGCRTILFNNGNETEWIMGPYRTPDFQARSFQEIYEIVLNQNKIEHVNSGISQDHRAVQQ